MDIRDQKRQVDTLFVVHAAVSAVGGFLAFVVPHIFEWLLIHHGESLRFRGATMNDDQKLTHLALRLFGALLLAQAWIVWHARKITEPETRRALVQAYFGTFVLSTVALLRAQLTEGGGFSSWNWLTILLFAGLAGLYGVFVFLRPIKVFEGLGRALA
jgi:hypothetical protein